MLKPLKLTTLQEVVLEIQPANTTGWRCSTRSQGEQVPAVDPNIYLEKKPEGRTVKPKNYTDHIVSNIMDN
jgi:hypothetical protein